MPSALLTMTDADVGAVPLATEINAVVGTSSTTLTRPANAKFLHIRVDVGAFLIRNGSGAIMPSVEFPASTVADGTAALRLPAGASQTFPVADTPAITVKGFGATPSMTYFWR